MNIFYREKVFKEVAEAKYEHRNNLNITDFGFSATPYYEFFEKYNRTCNNMGI